MAESPDELYRRVAAAADADGRLPLPSLEGWETFPIEGELRVKPLLPPEATEPPRRGEEEGDCRRCSRGVEGAIWHDDRWLVTPLDEPSGLPVVVLLQPRAHGDLGDLDDETAADLGRMLVRVERAVRSVPGVARVHVGRWGEGSAHLHWWFLARPFGFAQLRSSFAEIWDSILPPLPRELWRENLATVAATLAEGGGVVPEA
jgi:diadenosine tetraphosphate (Ap4A) HIT family hydrolase